MFSRPGRPFPDLAPATLGLLSLVHALTYVGAGPVDDDFIVYRYARHWVEGQGLVFQAGERFEGFTSPLWVLLVAAGLKLGIAPERLALTLGPIAAALSTWVIARWSRREAPRALLPWPAVVLALCPAFAWHAVAGLGTSLCAAALSGWFVCTERGRERAASLFLAVACLGRQEFFLLALPWTAHLWRRRGTRGAACLPLAALAAWTLFRLAYYGRWLPVTYGVKKLAWSHDLVYGATYLARSTVECGVLTLVPLAWWARGARAAGTRRAVCFGLTLHTSFILWVGGDFMPLARLCVPTLPLFLALGSAGGGRVFAAAPRALVLGLWIACSAVLLLSARQRPDLIRFHQHYESCLLRLGAKLGRELPPDTRVGTSAIGALGYASRLPLIDLLGLTHDACLDMPADTGRVHLKGHHRVNVDWTLNRAPELFVLGCGVRMARGQLEVPAWERSVFESPRFQANYAPWSVPIGRPLPAVVFVRHDAAPRMEEVKGARRLRPNVRRSAETLAYRFDEDAEGRRGLTQE